MVRIYERAVELFCGTLLSGALLLLSLPSAQAFSDSGRGSSTCPASVDGSSITAPSSCTLKNSRGTWTFGGAKLGGNYAVDLNGTQDRYSANYYENIEILNDGGMIGATIELNQGLNTFVQLTSGFCKNYFSAPPGPYPWYMRVNPSYGKVQWVETGSPTYGVPSTQFSYTGGASRTFFDAMENVPENGTVSVPAPPAGLDYWVGNGALGSTVVKQSGVTVSAAAGSSIFCGVWHNKGLVDILQNNDAVNGYSPSQPLQIGHVIAGLYAGPWYALNIEGPAVTSFSASNLRTLDSDMCVHVGSETTITFTNVSAEDCGSGSGSGWGLNHNIYVSGITQIGNESAANLTWNGGYDINTHGDGSGVSSGDLFKSRYPQTTLENMVIGENCSSSSCEERWVIDYDCGGKNTLTRDTIEMPAKTNRNGHEIIAAGDEAQGPWRSGAECWPAHVVNGATVVSGSQNQITVGANPAIIGVSPGDCVGRLNYDDCSNAVALPYGTIASITGSGRYTINLNPVTTGLHLYSFNSSTGAITVYTQINGLNVSNLVNTGQTFQLSGVAGVGSGVPFLNGTWTATGGGQYVLSFTCAACIGKTITSLSAGNLYTAPIGTNQSFVVAGYITATAIIANRSTTMTFPTLNPSLSEVSVGWAVEDPSGCLPAGDSVASVDSSRQITLASPTTSNGPCGTITVTIERAHAVTVSNSIIINDASGINYINSHISAAYIPITISAPMTIVTNGTLSTGQNVNGGQTLTQLCAVSGINCYTTRAAAAAANPSQWPSKDAWGNPCCAWPYLPPHP